MLHSIVLSKEGKFLFEQSSNKRLSSLPCSFFQDDALCPLLPANLPLKIYSKKKNEKKNQQNKQTKPVKLFCSFRFTSTLSLIWNYKHWNPVGLADQQMMRCNDRGPSHSSRYSLARLFAKSGSLRQKFFLSLVFLTMMTVTNSMLAVWFHQELCPISHWQDIAPASIPKPHT